MASAHPMRKRRERTSVEAKPTRSKRPTGTLALATALSHPLRIRILAAMHSPERLRSPRDLSDEMGLSLERVAYHCRELDDLGFLEVVKTRPVRGSVEHFYAPSKRLEAWNSEWCSLPPGAKRTLAASTLGLGVRALGVSIDNGNFESRDDSVIAQDTFWTDERGAAEALAILSRALADLETVAADAKDRLAESSEEGFLISFLLGGFEGALRPA